MRLCVIRGSLLGRYGSEAQEHIQDKATGNQDGLELDMEGSVLEPKVQEMILGARQISNDKPDEPQNVEEYEGDEKENEGKEVGLFTQFEMLLKAQRKKEVLNSVLVDDLETLLEKHAQTKPFEYHAQAIPAETKSKPIKFKDAVNRKFSFPFHLCATWAGMEELIKQAFLHVDVIGPHVEAGHYDLVGPNGEIILPQVWETMIEPDWSITMLMWPMPKPEKQELEGKVGSKKEDKEKFLGWIAGKATKMLKKKGPRTERSYP
ncbi:hypothetical protein B7494_g2761 [Chlorociboria aeruginascens]|nr:hypothetical protein B7494_g2761 [Chlorociboria aeruginascens]